MNSPSLFGPQEIQSITSEEADEIIREAEIKYHLFDYTLGKWCIWPILRFTVSMRLMNLPWTEITGDDKLSILDRVKIGLSDITKFPLRKSDFFLLTSSSCRADIIDNKYMDVYFDDFLPNIGSFFKLEHINNKHYLRKSGEVLIPSQLTTNSPYVIAGLLSKTGLPANINSIAMEISKVIISKIKVNNISPSQIAWILRSFYWRKGIYTYLLDQVRPHTLLLINAYNNHAIVAAAKEKYIKVVEFQHGLVSTHHPGYSWSGNSVKYKSVMPIPDKIFLYGDYWRSQLASTEFWSDELISVGSLRIDRYRKRRLQNGGSAVCKLIITTQGLDIANLCAFLVEFLQLIHSRMQVHLSIKLHPREHTSQIYKEMFKEFKDVTIILGSELPSTFNLLAEANLHASISSTCHYEALGLGLPTLILPFSSHEKVLHLMDTGYAYKVDSPAQMVELVINNHDKAVPEDIGNRFFLSNALTNILDQLTQ